MAKKKSDSAAVDKLEQTADSAASSDERLRSLNGASETPPFDPAPGSTPANASAIAGPPSSSTGDADESSRSAGADPIMDEVQAFMQRRRELAQKLRDEIELAQQRLEELQETLELLQGEMSVAEEREKKAKKPKAKSNKAAGKETRESRTRTLFDEAPERDEESEGASQDEALAREEESRGRDQDSEEAGRSLREETTSLPNEATVD